MNKKLTVKRLIIFLVISFLPFLIIIPVAWAYYGEPLYASQKTEVQDFVSILGGLGMMIPTVAHLLTRVITKEGFRNTYLGLNFKGHAGWYILSVVEKLIEGAVTFLLTYAVFMSDIPFSEAFSSEGLARNIGLYLLQLAFAVIIFIPAFGEEWGWRGYMMPKLCELMPKPAAVIVGGIIWGLWHAPLTVAGHNYGVDYPGYPFVGIGLMCLSCVCMNALLTLLTEKTNSIYPAAFCHMVNNDFPPAIFLSLAGTEAAITRYTSIQMVDMIPVNMIPELIVGIICFILLIRKDKPKEQAVENAA